MTAALGYVPEERLERLLNHLRRRRLVLQTDDGGWALARDLNQVTLYDLYRSEGFVLPEASLLSGATSGADQALARILEDLGLQMRGAMEVPLERLYRSAQAASEEAGS
jgi:DNA-binding IscR family transcriptional regulator